MAFNIVEFTPDKFAGNTEPEVAIIPNNWLDGTSCALWPPFKSGQKVTRAIKTSMTPTRDWKSYPMRVLDKADTYERAVQKQRKAEETSDLQTTADEEEAEEDFRLSKRKKKTTMRLIDDGDHDEDGPDSPPQKRALVQAVTQAEPSMTSLASTPSTASPSTSSEIRSLPPPPPPAVTPTRSIMNRSVCGQNLGFRQNISMSPTTLTGKDVTILKMLEEIKSELSSLHRKVDMVLHKQPGTDEPGQSLPSDVGLPLMTVAKLEEMEGYLSHVSHEKYLVSSPGITGRGTVQDTVRRIMKKVLHHDLAVATNWSGKGGKTAFGALKLSGVIIKAVRKNHMCMNATQDEIEKCLKEWLRGASDRNGGRQKRQTPISTSVSTASTPTIP